MPATAERLRSADRWLPLRRLSPRGRSPFVLLIHDLPDDGWFGEWLDGVARHARFLDIEQFMARWAEGTLEPDHLLLTFDDGYRSIHTIVEPACAARGIPYVAFCISDVIDGGPPPWTVRLQWLLEELGSEVVARALDVDGGTAREVMGQAKECHIDRTIAALAALEAEHRLDHAHLRNNYLTPEMVCEIHETGIGTIGLHTHRHPTLSLCSADGQREEIARCKALLESWTGEPVRWLAYPNGTSLDYDQTTIEVARSLDIAGAFTTNDGPATKVSDVFQIPRIGLNPGEGDARLLLRLALPWVSVGMWREHYLRVKVREANGRVP